MSELLGQTLLGQTLEALFAQHCTPEVVAAAEGGWARSLWERVVEMGLPGVGIPEALGGAGGDLHDAAVVVRAAARHGAPLPLAEVLMIGGWAYTAAGLRLPSGASSVAVPHPELPTVRARREDRGWVLSGVAHRVPWGSEVERVAIVASAISGALVLAVVDPADAVLVRGTNLAGEPRDDLDLSGVVVEASAVAELPAGALEELAARAALARAVQIAGAAEGVAEMTVAYARQRVQFGRAIGKFQAVQQEVALLGAEVAAATGAVDAALDAFSSGAAKAESWAAAAAAKIRAGGAAGLVARYAHQVHGAIGFTQEHPLHHLTRRLWSWRDEYGSDAAWAARLGHLVAARGADQLWPLVTSLG